jgi:hypothetical protein
MIGFTLYNTLSDYGHVARGICTATDEGDLADVVERTRIQKFGDTVKYTEDGITWIECDRNAVVSMNTWGFTPSIFKELETRFSAFLKDRIDEQKAEFFIPTVVNELIQEGRARVSICPTDETWFGMTYREDKSRAEGEIQRLIRDGVYPEQLWGEQYG